MPGSSPVQPEGVVIGLKGQLEFAFAYPAPAAQRRLLATINDVKKYRLTIKDAAGAVVFAPQELLAPTPANPKVFIRTPDLPVGSYTVLLDALDADGQVIGHAEHVVVIEAGICKPVHINLQLENETLDPTTGKLGLIVDVQDGVAVQPSTPCCSIPPEYVPLNPVPSSTPTSTPSPFEGIYRAPYFTDSEYDASTMSVNAAFDGDVSTWWSQAGNYGNSYIGKDFTVPTLVTNVRLYQTNDYPSYVSSIFIQASNSLDGPWETILESPVNTDGWNDIPIENPPLKRYWRIQQASPTASSSYYWAVYEAQFLAN